MALLNKRKDLLNEIVQNGADRNVRSAFGNRHVVLQH